VTIDSPGFSFRVQKRLMAGHARRIHYVAPSVWAWRPKRAETIARFLDRVLCLLPFEPPYFERVGLKASFVGHPVLEEGIAKADGPAFRTRHGIPADARLLAVLPGSRRSEVRPLLPIFQRTVERLRAQVPDLRLVLPTVPTVADIVRAAKWAVPAMVVDDVREKYAAFAASTAALAASGTVSVELGLARTPAVIAYRVHPATAIWVRLMVKVRHVSLANIIAGREIVPEFLQERCTPELLAPAVESLLLDKAARARQIAGVAEALSRLAPAGDAPSVLAAAAVLDEIGWRDG
jgi:lipid-A-disaccharide synthase